MLRKASLWSGSRLTGNLSYSQNLVLAAKDLMEDLTAQIDETCLIGVIRNNKRYILHQVQSDQDLQVRTSREADVFATACGRLLAAYLPPRELDNLLKIVGLPSAQVWPGVQTREALEKAMQKNQEGGICTNIKRQTHCRLCNASI